VLFDSEVRYEVSGHLRQEQLAKARAPALYGFTELTQIAVLAF
jgi:hypothetical protein